MSKVKEKFEQQKKKKKKRKGNGKEPAKSLEQIWRKLKGIIMGTVEKVIIQMMKKK